MITGKLNGEDFRVTITDKSLIIKPDKYKDDLKEYVYTLYHPIEGSVQRVEFTDGEMEAFLILNKCKKEGILNIEFDKTPEIPNDLKEGEVF